MLNLFDVNQVFSMTFDIELIILGLLPLMVDTKRNFLMQYFTISDLPYPARCEGNAS